MITPNVRLRAVIDSDVPVFYHQQLDPVATAMAAFPSRDWPGFAAHWDRIRHSQSSILRTIEVNGEVVGTISSYEQHGQWLMGYWLGQSFWGQGIATRAMQLFLADFTLRPVFAHVAKHNLGSQRVLEKNGFVVMGEQYLEADGMLPAVVEVELKLD